MFSYPEGGAVARYGETSGYDTGTIFARNVSNPSEVEGVGTMNVTSSVEVTFDSTGGDSGGPVIYIAGTGGIDRIGLGTHVHSDDDDAPSPRHGWYSALDTGMALYSSMHGYWYVPCITTTC